MLKVTLAQINLIVGNLPHNQQLILDAIEKARQENSNLVVFPELTICGYPPEDLIYHQQFIDDCYQSILKIANTIKDIAVVIGFPRSDENIYNSAAFIQGGRIQHIYDKQKLPNYLVFDEKRYFSPGNGQGILEVNIKNKKYRIGITICEDIWYAAEPLIQQVENNVDILINLSASPYAQGKIDSRTEMLQSRAKKACKPLIYCNLTGAQDELIFDGTSCAFNHKGELITQCKSFQTDIKTFSLDADTINYSDQDILTEIHQACIRGTRDYFHKNGFKKAVIGLSGGIDSALTAAIAVEALGPENVTGLLMPSRYSSDHSIADAQMLAQLLNIENHTIHIESAHQAFSQSLSPLLKDYTRNLTDENLQARIRGVLLMAWSNNHNALVLATGNKSEIAVGYCTLYGDMCGAYAPIKDLFKTQVYALSEHINRQKKSIPENTVLKPPSAELRPDQLDTDSLPEYDQLDKILYAYVHDFKNTQEIIKMGFSPPLVKRIIQAVDRNEYKRQQAAPGPRLTKMAFGRDRRMPLTNGYKQS